MGLQKNEWEALKNTEAVNYLSEERQVEIDEYFLKKE